VCNIPIANKILSIIKRAAERTNRKQPQVAQACFKHMLLDIVIRQMIESEDQENSRRRQKRIFLNYDLALEAIKSLFRPKYQGETVSFINDQSTYNQINAGMLI